MSSRSRILFVQLCVDHSDKRVPKICGAFAFPPYKHPIHPLSEFLQLDPAEQIPAHQDLLRAGKLVRYQPSFKNRVIFASHQVRYSAATLSALISHPPIFTPRSHVLLCLPISESY